MINLILLLVSVSGETLSKSDACTCIQIKSSNDCQQRTDCQWNTTKAACEVSTTTDQQSYCAEKTTSCPTIGCAFYKKQCQAFSGCTVYASITHSECQLISKYCTSNGVNCIDIVASCADYKVQESCQVNETNQPCYWDATNKACQEITECAQLPNTLTTHAQCYSLGQEKQLQCTAKDNGGCMTISDSCAVQTNEQGCVINISGGQCFWDSNTCKDKTCENAPTSNNSQALCQSFMSTCSLNEKSAGCLVSPSKCEDYTTKDQCVKLGDDICFWSVVICEAAATNCTASANCLTWNCSNAPASKITDLACQEFKNECTVSGTGIGCSKREIACSSYTTQGQCVKTLDESILCYWNGTKCVTKTCDVAVLAVYNDYQCSKYMSQCTEINGKCGLKTCSTFIDEDTCSLDYQNNMCAWSGSCTLRTCDNATSDNTTHEDCYSWLPSCTVQTDLVGCVTQAALCGQYKIQNQCYSANNGQIECLWIGGVCNQKSCATASNLISTDDECQSYLNGCMVKSNAQGCIVRAGNCSDLTQIQCSQTLSGTLCFWNGSTCVNRACTQALYNTFHACNSFMKTCTVNFDGTNFKGCMALTEKCSDNKYQEICITSAKDGLCIWNTKASPNACEPRSCANSDQTTSDAACTNHMPSCTVNSAKTGCISRFAKCSQFTYQINCVSNLAGGLCLWYNNACTDKTCDLADKTYNTHQQCQTYNNICTTNGKGCIAITQCNDAVVKQGCVKNVTNQLCAYQASCNSQTCSDAPDSYSTDEECRQFRSECTTNGNGCVKRTICSEAYIEEACVTNSSGNACTWINNRCIDYGCSSAPSKFITETECQLYKNGCTVNQSGGCVLKGKCSDAKILAACTTDINGNECYFSVTGCRNMICTDYSYTTHDKCIGALSTCTSNGVNCITQDKCQTKVQAGCYYGSDGPCLWVNGSCHQYTSCTSLIYSSHNECYQFNNQCTTNGNNCIPIDLCQNYQQPSCYQGTDGRCVYTPNSTTGVSECTLYKECKTGVFASHEECQAVDVTCTTDGKTCISLQEQCSLYTLQQQCVINAKNQKCYFDITTNKCNDFACSNVTYTTHTECNTQLSTCTTNATTCIAMDKCEKYEKVYCNIAVGTDGICLYDPTTSKCRLALCTELQDNCTSITKCVDSGIGCVVQQTCSKYTTEKGCEQGGTDGLCVWTLTNGEGSCSVMSSCADASTNKAACLQKSWNCQWTDTSTASTCATYTCSSYAKSTGSCQPILDFNKTNYSLCALTNQQCISTEFASLTAATCFQATAFTYTWDSANLKCLKCGTTYTNTTTPNTTNNTTNNTNTTTPSYQQVLFVTISLIISIYI